MTKTYIMVVQSKAMPGQDDEYNRWYDEQHIHDVLNVPGMVSGARYTSIKGPMPGPAAPYLAIYEIETDDIDSVMGEFLRRSAAGEIPVSTTLDQGNTALWLYEKR